MPTKARENTKLLNKAKETIEELELVIRGEKSIPSPKKRGGGLTQSQQSNQVKEVKQRTTRGTRKTQTKKAVWSSDEEDDDAENAPPQAPAEVSVRRSRRK